MGVWICIENIFSSKCLARIKFLKQLRHLWIFPKYLHQKSLQPNNDKQNPKARSNRTLFFQLKIDFLSISNLKINLKTQYWNPIHDGIFISLQTDENHFPRWHWKFDSIQKWFFVWWKLFFKIEMLTQRTT